MFNDSNCDLHLTSFPRAAVACYLVMTGNQAHPRNRFNELYSCAIDTYSGEVQNLSFVGNCRGSCVYIEESEMIKILTWPLMANGNILVLTWKYINFSSVAKNTSYASGAATAISGMNNVNMMAAGALAISVIRPFADMVLTCLPRTSMTCTISI